MAIFDDFVTLKEAGLISGYHPDYIGALVRSNKVTGKKIGKNWFVSKKELQAYFTTQHDAPAAKVLFGRTKVLFAFLIITVLGAIGVYIFRTSRVQPASVVSQSRTLL
jgi:hypothetical protein